VDVGVQAARQPTAMLRAARRQWPPRQELAAGMIGNGRRALRVIRSESLGTHSHASWGSRGPARPLSGRGPRVGERLGAERSRLFFPEMSPDRFGSI